MLDESGRVSVNFLQKSMSQLQATLKNNTLESQIYSFRLGSIIIPSDPTHQDIVILEDKDVSLQPQEIKVVRIQTACYNLGKSIPQSMEYKATNRIDPTIKKGMVQSQIWDMIQKRLQQYNPPESAQQLFAILKEPSTQLFQNIKNGEIIVFDFRIDIDFYVLEMEDPKNQGFQFKISQKNCVSKSKLAELNTLMGDDYLPGSVTRYEQSGKNMMRIRYPINRRKQEYFQRIDIISSKYSLINSTARFKVWDNPQQKLKQLTPPSQAKKFFDKLQNPSAQLFQNIQKGKVLLYHAQIQKDAFVLETDDPTSQGLSLNVQTIHLVSGLELADLKQLIGKDYVAGNVTSFVMRGKKMLRIRYPTQKKNQDCLEINIISSKKGLTKIMNKVKKLI